MTLHLIKPNLKVTLFLIMFLFFIPLQLSAHTNPWLLQRSERKIEGTIIKIEKRQICIRKEQSNYIFKLDDNILSALMGKYSGQLVAPTDFPLGIEVELFVNQNNKVRAMRNIQINLNNSEGKLLNGWGHKTNLSPDEKYYCLYNYETGLQLYSISSTSTDLSIPLVASSRPYFFPAFSWNNSGELAVALETEFFIFDPGDKKRLNISLPLQKNETYRRIITNINWNNSNEKILYTSLEDNPDTGSSFFKLSVINRSGRVLGSTIIENLGSSIWLSNDLILYLTYSNIDNEHGRLMLWNYTTNKTVEFLPQDNTSYQSFAYSHYYDQLALTVKSGSGEILYILDMDSGLKKEIAVLPYPIHNLQWSDNGALFYWDEYNNCIFQISNLPFQNNTTDKHVITPICNGYLPAESVRKNLIYFIAEPMEEPLQPYVKGFK